MMPSTPAPAQVTREHSPTPHSDPLRIRSLDVLRGLAVLGALFVSIWIFGGFSEEMKKQLLVRSAGWNYRIYGAMELLLFGKMRALIALVFGAAMVLFLARQNSPGRQPAGEVFIKRQLWLIIFGVINGVFLLWTNDIVFHLGVMGVLLFPFFRMKPRRLLIAALALTLIYCGKYYWRYADDKKTYNKYLVVTALEKKFEKDSTEKAQKGLTVKKDTLTKIQKQEKQAWEGVVGSMKVNLKKDEGNIKAMQSNNYGKLWNHLLPQAQSREAQWTYQFGIWDLGSMIFLGMFLFKIGFFNSRFSKNKYLLFGIVCLTAGLFLGWHRLHFQQISLQDYEKYIKNHAFPHSIVFPVEIMLMSVGYASLVMFFLAIPLFHRISGAFASVGKLALTNYLLQSIICTLFFYGYGMGYYGRLSQFELYFFVLELIMVQIVFSILWLKYYNYGPAEWLLRRLSVGKTFSEKMRRPPSVDPATPILT